MHTKETNKVNPLNMRAAIKQPCRIERKEGGEGLVNRKGSEKCNKRRHRRRNSKLKRKQITVIVFLRR